MKRGSIIAIEPYSVLSPDEIVRLSAMGVTAAIIPAILRDCAPRPDELTIRHLLPAIDMLLLHEMTPIVSCPTWPAPEWMHAPEYAYVDGEGHSHFEHTDMTGFGGVVNCQHPAVVSTVKGIFMLLRTEYGHYGLVDDLVFEVGYGQGCEWIGPTYQHRATEYNAPLSVWAHDPHSLAWFTLMYPDCTPARSWETMDWQTADYLSWRMARFARLVLANVPASCEISIPLIVPVDPSRDLHVCAGFATIVDEVRVLADNTKLNVHFDSVYNVDSHKHRLAYALAAQQIGRPAFVGGEHLLLAENAVRSAADGYHGMISNARTLLTLSDAEGAALVGEAREAFA